MRKKILFLFYGLWGGGGMKIEKGLLRLGETLIEGSLRTAVSCGSGNWIQLSRVKSVTALSCQVSVLCLSIRYSYDTVHSNNSLSEVCPDSENWWSLPGKFAMRSSFSFWYSKLGLSSFPRANFILFKKLTDFNLFILLIFPISKFKEWKNFWNLSYNSLSYNSLSYNCLSYNCCLNLLKVITF